MCFGFPSCQIEDQLSDAILNYFESVFISLRARNGRRRELLHSICSTQFDEMKFNATEDMKTTTRHFCLKWRTICNFII